MATLSRAESKRLYSWWWDSHISPKNSKWLQENLTDMDSNVKQMIKLIEEDADSFARRAEMYYKKRPELIKLVEEFYRAYRALAERYDHATGVIHQAHRTMAEAFPNQVPLALDDSPAGFSADPHTPPPVNASHPDALSKDAVGTFLSHSHTVQRSGAITDSNSTTSRSGLKQLNDLFGSGEGVNRAKISEGKVRKCLNFHDAAEKDQIPKKDERHVLEECVTSESDRAGKNEAEILSLKKALAKLEAERAASLIQYQQSLERLSNLESEVSRAQQDSRRLNERASKAESEVQTLKEALSKLESAKEASVTHYQQCTDKPSNLEKGIFLSQKDAGELGERANEATFEVEYLKKDLARVEAEKEAALIQLKQCLERISILKEQLKCAEANAQKFKERACKAEGEVESLKQAINELIEEKDSSAHRCQQCLERISSLEHKLSSAQEEAKRLKSEIDNGVLKLKCAEEKCNLLERSNQTLHSELESTVVKMGTQSQEITDKQKELGRLWTCLQEEHLRFIEAETAFQTLQHLHSQSQDELRSLAVELETRAQVLKEMEGHSQGLQEEIQKVKEENKSLNELNLSSALTVKNLQDGISGLRETIDKLEAEVQLRVDQRNALQQEIYCLKEKLDELNKKNQKMLEQLESVGLSPQSFSLSVKELQNENIKLKEQCERDRTEKSTHLEKLASMKKLLEKNSLLENTISELNGELEGIRSKVMELESSCQSLRGEKSILVAEKATLTSQLKVTTENLEKLSEENQVLENSLFDAYSELERLRVKLKCLEDSQLLLDNEKSTLLMERENLVSRLNITQHKLDDMENRHMQLNEKYIAQETERRSTFQKLEELHNSLDNDKEERERFSKLREYELASLEKQINLLQEESWYRKKEYEGELDKAVDAEIEIVVLQSCVKDLKEKISSLLIESQNLFDASQLSERQISKLENENIQKERQAESMYGQIKMLRMGLYQVLMRFSVDVNFGYENETKSLLNCIIRELGDLQSSYCRICEENQQLVIEKLVFSTLLGQLAMEATSFRADKDVLDQEFRIQSDQLCAVQEESQKHQRMNEELRLEVMEEKCQKEALVSEVDSLSGQLSDVQSLYIPSQVENSQLTEEKAYLVQKVSDLEEEKHSMEEENLVIFNDNLSLNSLSIIFKDVITEKLEELKELSKDMERQQCSNNVLVEKVKLLQVQLEDSETANIHLRASMEKSEKEISLVNLVNDQLNFEIGKGNNLMCKKDNELLKADKMLRVMQSEKKEIENSLKELNKERNGAKMICEDQEKQILKLNEVRDHQIKENGSLREMNENLEAELLKLRKKVDEIKTKEGRLVYELKKTREEVQLRECEAEVVFADLLSSAVCETLFEEKIHHLIEVCQNLGDRNDVKGMEIDLLKGRICDLESENKAARDKLAAFLLVLVSLEDCVASLENHTLDKEEIKVSDMASSCHANNCRQMSKEQAAVGQGGLLDFQDLPSRMKDIENAVLEMERHSLQEVSNGNNELDNMTRQIENLKSGGKPAAVRQMEELEDANRNNVKLQNPETSDAVTEVLMKDIMLDQISECSSYGKSRREHEEIVSRMFELWDPSDQDGSIDLTVGNSQMDTPWTRLHMDGAIVEKQKSASSSGLAVEKELNVDILETSKRSVGHDQEGNRTKILERLDSDAQKLTNLQITLEDLKRNVDLSEKRKKIGGFDYDSVKGQLAEVDESIKKLFDVNYKLVKSIKSGSLLTEGKSGSASGEGGGNRKKRVSEQARRFSEKIGRLQLEVQKLQFLLLNHDEERESRRKTRIIGRNTKVVLRDYLYGRARTGHQQRKAPFCGCVQPPTRGD